MANKTILMVKIRQIFRFYSLGKSKREISALTSTSRITVKKYIALSVQQKLTHDAIAAMSDHEPEQLFGAAEVPLTDARFEKLQQQLPEIDRKLKR